MLTSADAKWKCMWYLLAWSVLVTLVSLFLQVQNHLAFFLFAAVSVLLLPFFTAIYSNTAGRHGAGLLRAGLVLCDPVLACLTVTPVLLLNHLPTVVDQTHCLAASRSLNDTLNCTANGTRLQIFGKRNTGPSPRITNKQHVQDIKQSEFLVIQAAIVVPILLVLFMGRRTRKMPFTTYVMVFAYWFVIAIEAGSLLETLLISDAYKHVIYTTESITCIAMIGGNTYAIVTLLSYVTPSGMIDSKHSGSRNKFTFIYVVFMCIAGILFAEIPMFVARLQVLAVRKVLPGSFYMWLIKDVLFIAIIAVLAYVQRFGQRYLRIPCKPSLDNKHFFQPEKRDKYISEHRHALYLQSLSNQAAALSNHTAALSNEVDSDSDVESGESFSKCKSVPNISSLGKQTEFDVSMGTKKFKSTTHLDSLHQGTNRNSKKFKDKLDKVQSSLRQYGVKFKPVSTGNSGKVKKVKRVSFKIDIGRGKFLEMKARSDSPPIFTGPPSSPV